MIVKGRFEALSKAIYGEIVSESPARYKNLSHLGPWNRNFIEKRRSFEFLASNTTSGTVAFPHSRLASSSTCGATEVLSQTI